MRNKDFCILMLEQEKQKRSNGDESTADLYRATRNHFAAFIREGEKSGLLGDVTQDVVQEFVLYLKGKKLRVNSVNSYISNLRAMYNRACRGWKGRPEERPFEGMQLQREETVKRAVPVEVIKQMAALDLEEEPEKKLAVDMALGCSTNTMLHLPAIAHECGIELSFDMANEISQKTPNLCHLAPAGNTYMEDLERAGVQPVDMFARTAHVECVVMLERKNR